MLFRIGWLLVTNVLGQPVRSTWVKQLLCQWYQVFKLTQNIEDIIYTAAVKA
jgi:hypothetical protein